MPSNPFFLGCFAQYLLPDYRSCWSESRRGMSLVDADPLFIILQYYPDGNTNEYLAKKADADRAKIVSALLSLMV
jgi:hypothetical protein